MMILAFLYGAVVTILGAGFLSYFILVPLQGFGDCQPFGMTAMGIFSAVIVAPLAEELMKVAGILAVRIRIVEVEDGIIYGAAIGLGFAATENIIYFSAAIAEAGAIGLAGTAIVRSLTSTLLHLGATGLSGYGLGRYYAGSKQGARIPWWQFLLAAMVFHAVFNLFASLQLLSSSLEEQIATGIVGLAMGVVLTWSLFGWLRRKISELDRLPIRAAM